MRHSHIPYYRTKLFVDLVRVDLYSKNIITKGGNERFCELTCRIWGSERVWGRLRRHENELIALLGKGPVKM